MFEDFKQELKRPATAVAVILAVISLFGGAAFSLYFYYKSIKSADIYYNVQQIQAFDQRSIAQIGGDEANPLRIVDQNGKPVRNNVYAANLIIWNGSNDELRKGDVRSIYKIFVEGDPSFYNLIMYAQTNGNRDNFRLIDKNVIDWDHFDPGEGFKLRLIYASEKELKIELQGSALNTSNSVEVNQREKQFGAFIIKTALYVAGSAFLTIIVYSIFQNKTVELEKGGQIYRHERRVLARIGTNLFDNNLIMVPMMIGLVGAFLPLVLNYFLRIPAPPFG